MSHAASLWYFSIQKRHHRFLGDWSTCQPHDEGGVHPLPLPLCVQPPHTVNQLSTQIWDHQSETRQNMFHIFKKVKVWGYNKRQQSQAGLFLSSHVLLFGNNNNKKNLRFFQDTVSLSPLSHKHPQSHGETISDHKDKIKLFLFPRSDLWFVEICAPPAVWWLFVSPAEAKWSQFSAGGLTSRRALCPTCLKCAPRVVSNVRSSLVFFFFFLLRYGSLLVNLALKRS